MSLVILALRAILVVIGLASLGGQILIVVVLALRFVASEVTTLGVIHSALGVAALSCVQVGLLALGVLLSMVRRGAIFDESAFPWVGVVAAAWLIAAVIVAALCIHAGEIDDAPGLILIGGGIGTAGVAFALLMVVMHGLLRTATVLAAERATRPA